MVESKHSLNELCIAKEACVKGKIFTEIEIINIELGKKEVVSLGEILIDVYSIETVKQIKINEED
jgi:hypothetical protein